MPQCHQILLHRFHIIPALDFFMAEALRLILIDLNLAWTFSFPDLWPKNEQCFCCINSAVVPMFASFSIVIPWNRFSKAILFLQGGVHRRVLFFVREERLCTETSAPRATIPRSFFGGSLSFGPFADAHVPTTPRTQKSTPSHQPDRLGAYLSALPLNGCKLWQLLAWWPLHGPPALLAISPPCRSSFSMWMPSPSHASSQNRLRSATLWKCRASL